MEAARSASHLVAFLASVTTSDAEAGNFIKDLSILYFLVGRRVGAVNRRVGLWE